MENRSCYGQAFRQLRLDRGYSLKEAAGNIISPQMLGVLSMENLVLVLITLAVSNSYRGHLEWLLPLLQWGVYLKELSLSDEILVKINNGHYYDGF